MESMCLSLGGGEVKDLTAAPGSSNVCCDVCGSHEEVREWEPEDRVTSKVYHYCKVCWFDVQESADELRNLNQMDVEYEGGCDDCGSPTALTAEYWHADGRTFHLCERCYQSADDSEEYLESPPSCADCKTRPATETFNHLDGRSFKLCTYCFQLADHEDDYGDDFGSVPRVRANGPTHLCQCPPALRFHSAHSV